MTKIEKFLDELRAAFEFAPTIETSVGNDQLAISVRSKTQGLKNCINCKQLTIHPSKNKLHAVTIEEVWYGYDAEGYRWSDWMMGLDIDCNGLKQKAAIKHIVEKVKASSFWRHFEEQEG